MAAIPVGGAFAEFASRLEITDWQETQVKEQRARLEKALRTELYLDPKCAPRVIGSWARHTMIAPLRDADIDLLVVLDKSKYADWLSADGTTRALDRCRDILKKAFPTTQLRRDRNCITMHLARFSLDIVPAFPVRPLLTDHVYFRIPDTVRKRWVATDPDRFATAISATNRDLQQKFVPLLKMMKAWNRANGGFICSFHLETMLYRHFHGVSGSFERVAAWFHDYHYSWLLKNFLGELPYYLKNACYDPIREDRLDTYLDNDARPSNRQRARQIAEHAAAASREAYRLQGKSPSAALTAWRALLGDQFPAHSNE